MFSLARVLNCKSTLRLMQFKNMPIVSVAYSSRGAQQKQELNNASKSKQDLDTISNEPIQFFGSQAASWRAKDTRSGGSEEALWYQPYVISGSLAVFLIYFCILREENDIDRKLEGNLYDHVNGLEQVALTVNYKYNKEHGLDTQEEEKRLKELGVDINQIT